MSYIFILSAYSHFIEYQVLNR